MMTRTRYPDWAPEILRRLHSEWDEVVAGDSQASTLSGTLVGTARRSADKGLLERLITNREMRTVWKSIEKKALDDGFESFYWGVTEAFAGPEDPWYAVSPTDRQEWVESVQVHAKTLSKLLRDGPFRYPKGRRNASPAWHPEDCPYTLWPTATLQNLFENLDPKNAQHTSNAENDPMGRMVLCDWITEIVEHPPLDYLLDKLCEYEQSRLNVPTHLSRPGRPDANRTYFIRRLAEHNLETFGEPMYAIIRKTTVTVFELDSLDDKTVREAVKPVLEAHAKGESFYWGYQKISRG